MIRKSGYRFSEKIMLKQITWIERDGIIALYLGGKLQGISR